MCLVIESAFCVWRICGEILPKQKEERRGGGLTLAAVCATLGVYVCVCVSQCACVRLCVC